MASLYDQKDVKYMLHNAYEIINALHALEFGSITPIQAKEAVNTNSAAICNNIDRLELV